MNERLSSPWEDIKQATPGVKSGIKSTFNGVSNWLDNNPVFTKWATLGVAFFGGYAALNVMGKNVLNILGMNQGFSGIAGRAIMFGAVLAGSFALANKASSYMANKGADKRTEQNKNALADKKEAYEKVFDQNKQDLTGTASPSETLGNDPTKTPQQNDTNDWQAANTVLNAPMGPS